MSTEKKSFLSNLLGRDIYDSFKKYSKFIVPIGTIILVILFTLTSFAHWSFLNSILNFFTGTSLLFIAYIGAFIIKLDFEVDVEDSKNLVKFKNSREYKLTTIWGVILCSLGVCAVYFSNLYNKNYTFECSTFLLDENKCIYHLNYNNKCEYAAETEHLIVMHGFDIEKRNNCSFCEWCKEWAEDAGVETTQYSRR